MSSMLGTLPKLGNAWGAAGTVIWAIETTHDAGRQTRRERSLKVKRICDMVKAVKILEVEVSSQ